MAKLSPMKMKVRDVIAKSKGTKFDGVKETHYPVMVNKAEMGALNAMKKDIHERKPGGFVDRMVKKGLNEDTYIMKGTEPKAVAAPIAVMRGQGAKTVESGTERRDYGTSASAGLDNPIHNHSSGGGGDGGGGGNRSSGPSYRYSQLQKQFDDYKAGEQGRLDEAKKKALQEQRDSDRQKYVDKFDAYSDRFGKLGDQFDLSKERLAMQGLAGEAQRLGTQYGDQMSGVTGRIGGYEGDVAGLRSGVDALRQQQAGIGQQIGGLAQQAMDPASSDMYNRNRKMLAGVAEQQRKSSNLAAQEQLNRSAASSGMSPEKLALARAQLTQNQGAQARQDALSSAVGAQQMTGQQLAQGAGLLGQQAGLGMQQANLYGQQAGLGAQAAGLAGQQAGMFGQAAGFQSGLIGQRGGLMGQSAGLLQQQLMGKGQLLGQQAGMTTYGLQDVVARQNEAMQMEMMEKTNAANIQAARYGSSGGGGGGGGLLSSLGL